MADRPEASSQQDTIDKRLSKLLMKLDYWLFVLVRNNRKEFICDDEQLDTLMQDIVITKQIINDVTTGKT